jgi:hypothetical protein
MTQSKSTVPAKCIRHWPRQHNGCDACDNFWNDQETLVNQMTTKPEVKSEARKLSLEADCFRAGEKCKEQRNEREKTICDELNALDYLDKNLSNLDAELALILNPAVESEG